MITVPRRPVAPGLTGPDSPPASGQRTAASADRSFLAGLLALLGSGTSNQAGAALGARAFPDIGPVGVVAVRQLVAAAVLLPVARPPVRRFTWAQWWPTLLLALVFAVMNLSLYTAVDRLGLGLAVTLEFLGPLAVAVAGSRTRADLGCALAAGTGVYVLVLPDPSSDYLGIGLGLVAATCWAGYILLNRLLGTRLPGVQAPAVATSVSALAYLPVLVALTGAGRWTTASLAYAAMAGVMSTVVPYAVDLLALRHVPPRFFGVFMSVNPVLAAVAGLLLLDEVLALHEWTGIVVVVAANAVAVTTVRRPAADVSSAAERSARAAEPSRRADEGGSGRIEPCASPRSPTTPCAP